MRRRKKGHRVRFDFGLALVGELEASDGLGDSPGNAWLLGEPSGWSALHRATRPSAGRESRDFAVHALSFRRLEQRTQTVRWL
jgi:hypothetical protein